MGDLTEPEVDRLASVSEEISQLRDLFYRRLLEDKDKRRLYDELFAQLEFARSAISRQVVGLLLTEICLVLDRIDSHTAPDEFVESIRAELTELLVRRGVERIEAVR